MRVQDVMTEAVKTVAPTLPAEDAWNLMRLHGIHHLVVTDANRVVGVLSDRDTGGKVVGIVTVSDLLELLGRGIDHGIVNRTRWTLNHRVPHRKVHGHPKAW